MLIYLGRMENPSVPDTSRDQQQGLKPRDQTTTRIQGVSRKKKFCPLNVNWESFFDLDRSKSLCIGINSVFSNVSLNRCKQR
jgi:hypothetical protein